MEPACSLTHRKFFSSGDGGEVDLDVTRANFCSSSRKLKMEWQLSTQDHVLRIYKTCC